MHRDPVRSSSGQRVAGLASEHINKWRSMLHLVITLSTDLTTGSKKSQACTGRGFKLSLMRFDSAGSVGSEGARGCEVFILDMAYFIIALLQRASVRFRKLAYRLGNFWSDIR